MIKKAKSVLRKNEFVFLLARTVSYAVRRLIGLTLGKMRRPFQVRAYLKEHKVRKLHVGCGPNLYEGWLNTDGFPARSGIVYLDATRRLPFQNASWDFIYSEHFIEHISLRETYRLLQESFRCLKPGGVLRIATPDLVKICALLQDEVNRQQVAQHYIDHLATTCLPGFPCRSPAVAVNLSLREWGHKFIFDFKTLSELLGQVGFKDITECAVSKSEHLSLQGIEKHGEAIGSEDFNLLETMVVEATKPSTLVK
ncbi:class I SAM-dependent methyltransferase [Terasakiella pusilla]|uniref:class I SAM-dependent methyltransferase n=1 Tax=Terasakiella pusilla TaxID=64973 RepID=UPI003AA9D810